MSTKHTKNSRSGGFTLIEMLVAVTLFSIVMTVSMAAIFSIINANKKAQAINSVVNNLNFSIESMVRDMKTGIRYSCPGNADGSFVRPLGQTEYSTDIADNSHDLCTTPSVPVSDISFYSTLGGTPTAVEYRYVPPTSTSPGVIKHIWITGPTPQQAYDLTSPEVNITSMSFYVNNPGTGTLVQPSIFLIINAEANIGDNQVTKFKIQTLVSQRILNV